MDKKLFILIVIGICIVVIVGIFVSSFTKSPTSSIHAIVFPSPVSQEGSNLSMGTQNSPPTNPPEDVVKNFYSWYMSNSQNPLTTGAYKKSTLLTTAYKKTIDELLPGDSFSGADPVFCSVNKTKNPAVEPAVYNDSNNQAIVVIHDGDIDGGKSIYKVMLNRIKDKWAINDIICLP